MPIGRTETQEFLPKLVAWFFLAYLIVAVWYSKARFAIQYRVSFANISMEDRPHDCDFLKAPIGDKECHFEPEVAVFESEGKREIALDWRKVAE